MSTKVIIIYLDDAHADIDEADVWWRVNRPENPDGFLVAIERGVALLAMFPSIGLAVRSRAKRVRRLVLTDVPHQIFYRVVADRIEVLRVWDGRHQAWPRL